VCEGGISTRLEIAVVEIVIGKFQNGWVGPEIFDKLDNSNEIIFRIY
jgi:hypothetical protein